MFLSPVSSGAAGVGYEEEIELSDPPLDGYLILLLKEVNWAAKLPIELEL